MSGGSFGYLHLAADLGRLGERRDTVQEMADALNEYQHPGAATAAADAREVLALLSQADEAARRLAGVWRAVEWHYSADWGTDQVRDALAEYASAMEQTCTHFSEHGWGRCVEPRDHPPGKHMYRLPAT